MQRTLPLASLSVVAALAAVTPSSAIAQAVIVETAPDADPTAVATDPRAPSSAPVIVIELVPAEPQVVAVQAAPIAVEATQYVTTAPASPDSAEEVGGDSIRERPLSIGLSGLIGFRDGTDGLVTTWTAGFDLAYRVAPWARIAIRRVTFGYAETSQGDRVALGASPALDLSVPLGDVVEPFAELGVAVQARLGGRSPSFGLAPFVAAGARFHVADCVALGAEAALTVPATEHVLIGHELFPRASILVQLGASVEMSF